MLISILIDFFNIFFSGLIPHAVRKRTPRVPVSYSDKDNVEKTISPMKQNFKHNMAATSDDVTHEIAMALTEASQKGGSPLVSQMPNRKIGRGGSVPTPLRNRERMVSFCFLVFFSCFYLNNIASYT